MQQKETDNKELRQRGIQDYLSLGYVYLVVVGIILDAIFYGILGINIIRYSSILDVLLSPIAFLTNSIIVIAMIGGMLLLFFGVGRWNKSRHEKNRDKEWYRKKYDVANLDKQYAKSDDVMAVFNIFGIFFISLFISYSTFRGNRLKKKIANQELELNRRITFQNDRVIEVSFIGMNSQYVFYLLENDSIITASPIQGNIKGIRKLVPKE